MVIYVACYSLIGMLYYRIGNKNRDRWKLWIGIVLLSLLAGCRDRTVGTDVMIYGEKIYRAAKSVNNWKSLCYYILRYRGGEGIEIGYLLYEYFSAVLFGNSFGGLFGGLFTVSLFINTGVILGLYRIKEHLSFNIAASAYCFLFYHATYNGMRQWMAMAVIIFGLKYIYDRKPLKYAVSIVFAMLFHRTAIIGIALYLIALFIENPNNRVRKFAVVAVFVVGLLSFKSIVFFLTSHIAILGKYAHYAQGDNLALFWPEVLVRLPPIALCTVLYFPMKEKDQSHEFWYLMMIIELITSQLHSITDLAPRVGQYFSISQVIEMSMACRVGRLKQRTLVKILVVIYIVLYWFVMYIYFNYSETYPYMSRLLGIR